MIKVEKNSKSYFVLALVCYSVLVFAQSVFLKFTYAMPTQELYGTWANSLAASSFSDWAPLFRSYGHYLVANFELVVLFLLIFPFTRIFGAALGLLIITVTLLSQILSPVGVSVLVDNEGLRDGGLLFALSIGAWLALLLLICWPTRQKQVEASHQVRTPIKEIESSTEVPEIAAVEELVALDREIPFETEETVDVEEVFSQLIFDVKRNIRDLITGEHKDVLEKANDSIATSPAQPEYFPRRPMIIPKLIRAVNNEDSTKKDLVEVIGQDPVLTGELLRVANSPFFRISEEPVDGIGRAVVMLGIDGLKSLASALVMRPVIQVKISYFPEFPKHIWLEAVKAALAAQAYARKTKSCDSFTAHLLGLLSSIGHIVIFKMLLDIYKDFSGLHPKLEVLNILRHQHADSVTAAVVKDWGMSDEFVGVLTDYQRKSPINDMNPLGRALYYGHLCASLHMIHEAGRYTEEEVRSVVKNQGLHTDVFEAMWEVLNSDEANSLK